MSLIGYIGRESGLLERICETERDSLSDEIASSGQLELDADCPARKQYRHLTVTSVRRDQLRSNGS